MNCYAFDRGGVQLGEGKRDPPRNFSRFLHFFLDIGACLGSLGAIGQIGSTSTGARS